MFKIIKMNNKHIVELQNDPEILSLLTAQRCYYSEAKTLLAVGLCCSIVYAILMALSSILCCDKLDAIMTLFCACVGCVMPILLDCVSKKRCEAAAIQQWVDCWLYTRCSGVDFMTLTTLNNAKRDEIVAMFYNCEHKNEEDWYEDYSTLTAAEEIHSCQIENISWDKRLKASFIKVLIGLLLLPCIGVVIYMICFDVTFTKIVLVLAWLVPLGNICWKYTGKIIETRKLFIKLDKESNDIDFHADGVFAKLMNLQNQIYSYRQCAFLVPDFFFRKHFAENHDIEKTKSKIKRKERQNA